MAVNQTSPVKAPLKGPIKFDTFAGVFTPAVLAIFGAVVYYITPRVLGGVGMLKMLIIILLAHSVTIATAYSISGISTNIKVRGGGLYYLISRSLGTEFGGSMGIQLFFAQTISISFYTIAFATAMRGILGSFGLYFSETEIAVVFFILFWAIAFIGARFVIKVQFAILIAILVSFVAIFTGPSINTPHIDLFAVGVPLSFWMAFTMFFPAVTGMDAGVGMSGDLKNPRKSLVVGAFSSIIFTMILYIALSIKYFMSATLEELSTNPYVIQGISAAPILVIIGILMSTSSSALSYLMTSPRTLRAMVIDRLFSKQLIFIAKGYGKSNEPRFAMIFTFVIGLVIVLLGNLYLISLIVGIFFLTVYGWINGAAFLEKISKNPSYRPTFDSPAAISLYGMITCYVIMFLFNPWIMIGNIAFQILIFYTLIKKKSTRKLDSVWDGVLFQILRFVLSKIADTEKSKKNWQPTIIAFVTNETNKSSLVYLLDWIGSNSSITKLYFMISKFRKDQDTDREIFESDLKQYIKESDIKLFPKVVVTKDYNQVFSTIVQSETLGNLPLNTVLLDFDENFKIEELINESIELKKNIMLLRNNSGFSGFKRIDIWWSNPKNGNLMLLIGHMINHSKRWKEQDAYIRLFKIVDNVDEMNNAREQLTKIIEDARMDATIEIILKNKPIEKLMYDNSHNSDLVIIGLPRTGRSGKATKSITKEIKKYTDKLNNTLVIYGHDVFDLKMN